MDSADIYFAWKKPKSIIIINIFLILTSFLIIPLVFLIFLNLGYSRILKISRGGAISIPGNLLNANLPKNVYMRFVSGTSGIRIGYSYYFDEKNVKKASLINRKEIEYLRGKLKTLGGTREPSTNLVTDLNKTILIEFKKPLAFSDGIKIDDTAFLEKIYISLKNPDKFVDYINK